MRRKLVSVCMIVGLVVGMPVFARAEEDPPGEPREVVQEAKKDEQPQKETSVIEDSTLVAASVAVSAGQIPLRAATCAGTAVVTWFAYLLTVFDTEARHEPGEALRRVCEGPYTTSPEDLRER